jgi:hypothetical protein
VVLVLLIVLPVVVIESMPQLVTVHKTLLNKTLQSVHHVQMLVKPVTLMETVSLVPLTDLQNQSVLVSLVISKL